METGKLFVLDQNEHSVTSEELLKIPTPHSPLVTVVRGLGLGVGEG